VACSLLALAVLCAEPAKAQQDNEARYDLLIAGGRVLDGTGNPWVSADIGIRGERWAELLGKDGPG
jgi:adenine deaminase